ncbi:hypothetical protein CLCR_11256 [Cladophialophora carrionii]|uniref:Uncharacterized protein n=1 Tax=Cladophialophora carrionii TaxID=86049 RepID=A0A1C1CDZ1_9EURO|nr:hypothetical protein CLCR_11256 [Cladophialophora carrionii]
MASGSTKTLNFVRPLEATRETALAPVPKEMHTTQTSKAASDTVLLPSQQSEAAAFSDQRREKSAPIT